MLESHQRSLWISALLKTKYLQEPGFGSPLIPGNVEKKKEGPDSEVLTQKMWILGDFFGASEVWASAV